MEKGANFRTTIKGLNAAYQESAATTDELEGTGRVLELRDLRNGVQHAGNTPTAADVDRYRVYAEDFLDGATRALTGVSLRDLSRASLLHQAEIREAIQRAERSAIEENMDEAAEELAIAFAEVVVRFRETQPWRRRGRFDHYNVRRVTEALVPKKPSSSLTHKLREALLAVPMKRQLSTFEARNIADAVVGSGVGDTRPLLKVLQDLVTEVDFLTERVEAAMVVGDVGEHAWFRARVGKATAVSGPGKYVYVAPEPALDQREFQRATTFVINAALRLQLLEESPPPEGSLRGLMGRQQQEWEELKDDIVGLAQQNEHGRVLVDDIIQALGVNDTSRVEPAITELLEEGRLVQVATEAFELSEEPAPSA